jgi:hypothetical protein
MRTAFPVLTRPLRRLTLALMLAGASASSFAIPVMDMHIEDLINMGPDFKKELALTPNQDRLWSQVDGKTRQLVRDRLSRREHLQTALQQGLQAPNVELRDMVGALDSETATTAAEEKQLREWWLSVNDALDETQRRAVATFFAEQMLRVQDSGPSRSERPKGDVMPKSGGGRHGGGMGGMGSGAGGGNGNGSVNVALPSN